MDTNLIKAFSGLADASRENIYTTDIDSKISNLAQKQQEKLARLGSNSQYANLDESYTKLDTTGTIESNKNKIWNDESAAGIQMAVGEAANEAIYTRPDGTKYQLDKMGNERDFNGQTRRAYLYGTKDDPNAVKFGLALGTLPSSDYRYQPGRANREGLIQGKEYGWDPGENGVDVNKKYMDIELPYQTATALEAMIHGRKDALANRKYPDYLSEEAINHASGVSEYYNSMEGMLGDSRNQEGIDHSRLQEFKKLAPVGDTYKGSRAQQFAATFNNDVPEYNQLRGIGSSLLNVGAKIGSLLGEGLETLGEQDKAFLEREQGRLDKQYPGEKVSNWRKNVSTYLQESGHALNKEMREFQLNNRANNVTGYSSKNVDELSKEIGETIKTDGYLTAIGKAVTDSRSLEVLTNSLPEMVALAASVGGMAVVNVHNNIDLGQAEIGREFTTKERVLSAATSIVSTYLDRAGDKLALSGMNEAKGLLKTAIDKAPESVKTALATQYGKDILAIGSAPLRLAGAGAVEGITEYGQTLGETAAQDPNVFTKGFTNEQMNEADVAGVLGLASGGHMAAGGMAYRSMITPDSTKKEELAKKLEELQTNTEAEAKANMNSTLDMETPVEVTEADTKLGEDLGVQSVKEMHNESKSVDELKDKMEEAKMQILDNVYEYELDENGNSRITGVKDPSKLKAAEDWLDEYARYQADAKGNVPKGVQEEIEYIKNAGIEAGLQTVETKVASAEEKLAKAAKAQLGETNDIDDIEKQVAATIAEYKLDKVEGLHDKVVQQVKNMYGISGMSVAGNAKVELDKDTLNQMVAQNAGIRTHLDQKATSTEGKVIEVGSVTNEALADAVFGLGTEYDSAHPNTKFRERVLRHLDPTTSSTVVDRLRGIGSALASVVDNNVEAAGKVLKGGDVKGNMLRLGILTLSTIDAQVASDTELRENTIKDSSMLKSDEYYASLNNVIEQIGKNYATSYGLKVTGKAEDVAKVYRDLGRLGIDLAQQAGLIEVTNDYMWNRAGDVVDSQGNKLVSAAVKEGVETNKGKDALTGKDVLLTKDRGVRLVDTVAKHDELAEEGNRNNYKSELGNAAKRVTKLLLPNSERVPSTEYVKRPRKKDPNITIDEQTEKDIEHREKTPLVMKRGKIYDVLKYLKGENESIDGGLNNIKNPRIRTFLGLKDLKSKLLSVGERGANMSKLDNIIGILDNLDTLANENGVYYTFQVDINDRLTVEQSVANYQSDKVYARPIMGTGEHSVTDPRDKQILINSIVDELASNGQKGMNSLDVLAYYADIYNKIEEASKGDMKAFVEILAGTMENGLALAHLNKLGGIRVLSALEAARDVVNSNGGTIVTEYIPEKDASASGVFNTLLNIAGRNPKVFKTILTKLGVKFDGGEFTKDRTDAYSMLGQKIDQMIKDMTDMAGIATTLASQHMKAVAKIKETLDDDKLLRDLAKYPIMTWFYSAEKDSIVDNLTKEMTDVLVERAILGDTKALKYISDIAGKEMSIKDVQEISKGDKVHIALREELNKIGEAYYMQLTEVFPEVEANKKEMQDHFDLLQKNSTVDGKDYWDGRVRTALGALHGTDATMSLYKWKNQAMELSAQEKIDMGLATEDESTMLFTKQNRLANVTSMLALMMHSIDAAQAIVGQAAVGGNYGMQLIHDGFRSIPRNLRRFQETAEKVTVEVAEKYDIMGEMAWAMRQTAKNMEDALDDASPSTRKELEFKINKLKERADAIDAKNKAHLDAKKDILKNAETSLFGMEGKEEVAEKVATTPEVTVEEKIKEVTRTVLDVVESLNTVDGRKADILSGKYNDVLVTLDDKVKAELLKSASKDAKIALEEKFKQGGSFAYKNKVYVGSLLMAGKDEVMNRKARDTEILSTLMHEIEHTVIDEYVNKEANGAIKVEFEKIVSLLNKAKGKTIPAYGRARNRVANIIHFAELGNMEQAVKELVATSKEDEVAVQVFEALNRMAEVKGNLLERLISAVWSKIKSMLDNTSVEELLAKTDAYSLAIAVQSIQDKARGLDKGIAKAEDGKILTDKTPFDEDFSEYTKDLDNIC